MCLARLNDIEREFTKLDEHIASANVNFRDRNMLAAGYVSANVAWHALNVYAGAGAAYMPQAGSILIGAASFSDALLNGVTPVNYVGAFAAGDTWMDDWTNFDPTNTDY